MIDLPLSIVIIVSALCGLSIASFIHLKKRLQKPLVCPLGNSCDSVIHSDYSRFLHIPLEVWGMTYYALIATSYSFALAYPALVGASMGPLLLGITSVAFLFSIYLTGVQAFLLRQWCTWCLISATLCTIIFFSGLKVADLSLSGLIQIGMSLI